MDSDTKLNLVNVDFVKNPKRAISFHSSIGSDDDKRRSRNLRASRKVNHQHARLIKDIKREYDSPK